MDAGKLLLTDPVSAPMQLDRLDKSGLEGASEEQKKRTAKDFESVLVNKLLDEMKNTVGNWGFEKDGPSSQVQGIFWLYLAREVGSNGGVGLWKDIYQYLNGSEPDSNAGKSVDGQI